MLILGTLAARHTAGPATPAADTADRATVVTLVMNAVTQVKLCELALNKSQNTDVRSLCRTSVSESARMAIAGMQLAQAIGASDAKLQPSPQTPLMLQTLAQYSGRDFDREFLLAQIETAEDEAHTLRYEVEVTSDLSVKRYENAVLPKIERHLELTESVLRAVSEATL